MSQNPPRGPVARPLGRRPLARRLGAGLALLAAPSPLRAQEPPPGASAVSRTMSADAFLGTVGVGAHWEYPDSVYGRRTPALADALVRAGIRHVRGYDTRISADLAERGVLATLVAGPEVGSPARIADMVERANRRRRVIDAVEGPNEVDLFWVNNDRSYRGMKFPEGVLAYQHDLYRALKDRRATADVLVIGPSLGGTYDPGAGRPNPFARGALAEAVDLGNFHPYPFGGNSFSLPFRYGGIERYYWNGNFPSVNLDEYPYNPNVYAPPFAPKPMAATETGYFTGPEGVSEAVHARYVPRLFAEYARLGVRRTYLYELADMSDLRGREAHFGLMRGDASPKPAFTALAGLLRLVADGATRGVGGAAPQGLLIEPEMPPGYDRVRDVHSLLLRQSRDRSLLLVWHEVAGTDTSTVPPREITVSAGRATITLPAGMTATSWYDYDSAWQLRARAVPASSNRIVVPLRDQIVVVALRTPG